MRRRPESSERERVAVSDGRPARSTRLVIRAGWVIPVDPAFRVIRNGEVVVEAGRVVSVGPAGQAAPGQGRVVEFPRHALLPGLVNAHTHVAGCLFRGLTEDRSDGFYGLALPMERHLDDEAVYALSRVGIAEVMLAGCTVINEIYHKAAETARAAVELGVRAHVAHKVFDTDLTTIQSGERREIREEGERRLRDNIELYDRFDGAGGGRVTVRFGAHAADTCSPDLLAEIRQEARQRRAGHHIHVAQSPEERDFMAATYHTGSIEFLAEHDFIGPEVLVAHVVYATPAGIEVLRETDTPVAHCPAIIAKRGRFAPVKDLYEAGVRVGWGTDWVTMDPWDAMRFGIAGTRLKYADIGLLSAREALWRSTMGSAGVLGESERLGSLEPGKAADLILVDMDQPHLCPVHDPVTVLVYNATGRDVTHVMVGGDFVVSDRELAAADTTSLVSQGQSVAERVWRAARLEPVADGLGPRWGVRAEQARKGAAHV